MRKTAKQRQREQQNVEGWRKFFREALQSCLPPSQQPESPRVCGPIERPWEHRTPRDRAQLPNVKTCPHCGRSIE